MLIASELASRHDVLVLEKASSAPKTKFWLTDRGSSIADPELVGAIDILYQEMQFTAYDGTSYTAQGNYCLWSSDRLLALLTEQLVHRGGRIDFGERFFNLTNHGDGVTVYSNDRRINCRMVIDCMGVGSPIVYAKNVADVLGFYLLYGATFDMREPIMPVALHNLMLSHQPGWIEAFPTSDSRIHIVLIVPTAQLRPPSDLKADFSFITSKSHYAKHLDLASATRRFLGGVVPVARMRRRAIDRVLFFGEAGQVNPAASATALTRMLYNRRAIAIHITDCLRANALNAASLGAFTPYVGPLNQRLQRTLFRDILRWNSDDYLRIVRELRSLDDSEFVNHLIFGDLPESVPSLARYALRLWQTRSFALLGAMTRSLATPVI